MGTIRDPEVNKWHNSNNLTIKVEVDKWYDSSNAGYKMPFSKSIVNLSEDHPFKSFSDKHKTQGWVGNREFFYTVEVDTSDHISGRFSLYSIEGEVIRHIYSLRSYLRNFQVKGEFTENYFIERARIKKNSEKFGL
jgi:hypothetical protein